MGLGVRTLRYQEMERGPCVICARAGARAWFRGFSAMRKFSWQAALRAAAPAGPAGLFVRMLLGCFRARGPLLAEALRRLQFEGEWRQRRARGMGPSPTKV